jgi:plastocyanin
MKNIRFFLLLFCLFLIAPLNGMAQDTTGILSGRVLMPQIKKEKRTFRGRMYRNRLSSKRKSVSKSKTLKSPFIDVIVVMHPLTFKKEAQPMEGVKIIQKNAAFIPRVVPVTRNTVVEFINYDKFYHNVFSVTPGARFNLGRRPTGTVVNRKIERPGEIKLFCDIHAQMNATILSLDTPFFTRVNTNGKYKLTDLPEGQYLVEVYHPDLPKTEEHVTITAGDHIERSFTLSR